MKKNLRFIAGFFLCFVLPVVAMCQSGSPDMSFGDNGFVLTGVGTKNNSVGYDVVVQPDGKTVVSGKAKASNTVQVAVLMRYNRDGSADNSFGDSGMVLQSYTKQFDNFSILKIQEDGKLLVAGLSIRHDTDFVLFARYNADGSMDKKFRTQSTAFKYYGFGAVATDMAVLPDHKILLLTNYNQDITYLAQSTVERYNEDGTLDAGFGNGGRLTYTGSFWFTKLAVDKKGNIVCLSGDGGITSLLRLLPNGSIDRAFGTNGLMSMQLSSFDGSAAVITQPDGKIIVGGFLQSTNFVDNLFSVSRFNIDGTLDKTFNGTGSNRTKINGLDYVYDLSLQPNGKLIATGFTSDLNGNSYVATMRYNTRNGRTDSTWGADGVSVSATTWNGVTASFAVAAAISSDGSRLVVTGNQNGSSFTQSEFLTARYVLYAAPVAVAETASAATINSKAGFSVYPNPVANSVSVSFALKETTPVRIRITDINGKPVKEIIDEDMAKGSYTMNADIHALPAGLYTVILQAGNSVSTKKIIKQ